MEVSIPVQLCRVQFGSSFWRSKRLENLFKAKGYVCRSSNCSPDYKCPVYSQTSVATVSLTYIDLAFLVAIIVFAYPTFRIKRHDAFERMHRFMGWTATALVWSQVRFSFTHPSTFVVTNWFQVVVLTNDYKGDKSLGHALVHSAPFWLMMVLSWSLILPWTKLQKVPVRSVVLSNHAVRLFVDYGQSILSHPLEISDSVSLRSTSCSRLFPAVLYGSAQ